MEEYKPFLMWDETKKDGHAETIIDYVLSWCLRCTKYPFIKDYKPILYKYCKYMLCKLLDKLQDMNNIVIDDVRVRKQEHYIDLWVEVELQVEDRKEFHAILIENKYYSGIHDNQLERYKHIFDEYYNDRPNYHGIHRHYVLITCLYDVDTHYAPLEAAAKEQKFDMYHLYELADASLNFKESESDIYNELFLRNWV